MFAVASPRSLVREGRYIAYTLPHHQAAVAAWPHTVPETDRSPVAPALYYPLPFLKPPLRRLHTLSRMQKNQETTIFWPNTAKICPPPPRPPAPAPGASPAATRPEYHHSGAVKGGMLSWAHGKRALDHGWMTEVLRLALRLVRRWLPSFECLVAGASGGGTSGAPGPAAAGDVALASGAAEMGSDGLGFLRSFGLLLDIGTEGGARSEEEVVRRQAFRMVGEGARHRGPDDATDERVTS